MKSVIVSALAVLLGLLVCTAAPAYAKGKKDPCRKADIKLAKTGLGDFDGDGISDCRESKVLRTDPKNPDTDGDGLDDGDEIERFCHAREPDTDDDGVEDGDDETPVVEQEMEALLDAIACPVPGTPETPGVNGSISALGTTAVLTADTEFGNKGRHEGWRDKSCEDLAAGLGLGEMLLVNIEILEDMLGTLTATKVDVKERPSRHQHPGHGDDDDDDDDRDRDDD